MLFHAPPNQPPPPSSPNRTAWNWCSSSPRLSPSPPCRSLSEMSTISWWAARTAPSTCRVVMEGGSLPDAAGKPRRLFRPSSGRLSNKCSPLTSLCNANPTLNLPLFEVSLLPSHPVFLFRLSVMFLKVVQHKQGTHAGETNHSSLVPPLFFSLSSVLYVLRFSG